MPKNANDKLWTNIAKKMLVGRTITEVNYMHPDDADEQDWSCRPLIITLDDGNIIYASSDDEGNDGGALFTNNEQHGCLPVMR